MNKDFLPKIYQEVFLSKDVETYRKAFLVPIKDTKDDIQWMIDYIRKTLKGISFHHSHPLNEREIIALREYRKERKDQLNVLAICEITIKQETNNLLNATAGGINYKWEDYDLVGMEGFQESKLVELLDKQIPLPIQSIIYSLSDRYCLLTKCAINAMILKSKVDVIIHQYSYAELVHRLEDVQKQLADLKSNINQGYSQTGSSQETIVKKRKRKELTQVVAATAIHDAFSLWYTIDNRLVAIKMPSESVLKQRFSEWNAHIDNNQNDIRTQPYPGYETAIKGSKVGFYIWACTVFAPLYLRIEIEKARIKQDNRKMNSIEHDDILDLYRRVQDEKFSSFKSIIQLAIKNNRLEKASEAIRNLPAYNEVISFILPSTGEMD